jgi:hypothetical protein
MQFTEGTSMTPRSPAGRRHAAVVDTANALRHVARGAMAAALCTIAFACAAVDPPAGAARGDRSSLNAELVKPGLYRIDGGGGAALVRVTPEGLVVVDSKLAGMYEALMSEMQRIAKSPRPAVRALILTGSGREQAGNVARFIDAGVPLIVEKRALAGRRAGALAGIAAAAPRPLVVGYDADYRLHAGGVVVEVEHVGRGRTGADSVVWFPDLRVAAVGELFTTDTPQPDCTDGGSFAGWAAAITHLLWWDFDVAVPSHGPPVGKAELVALKAKLEALAERGGDTPGGAGCGAAAGSR